MICERIVTELEGLILQKVNIRVDRVISPGKNEGRNDRAK